MMYEAQTPEGKLFWLDELENPLAGSPKVILKLRQAAEFGVQAIWPGDPTPIDLLNFGDVRFALEIIYKDEVTFSDNAPEASQLVEPIDPDVIY
jgi:hypothetical protein